MTQNHPLDSVKTHKNKYILSALAVSLLGGGAIAAEPAYPARPLRIVNGFPPGGTTDLIARAIAQKLTERVGQTVIVENRPGAGSMIGSDYVAKATPDGYTLLLVSGAFPTQAAVLKNLPYDPLRDFAWITNAVSYPFVVMVKSSSPMQSVGDLIAAAKKITGQTQLCLGGYRVGTTSGGGIVQHHGQR